MDATAFWEKFTFDYRYSTPPELSNNIISIEAYRQAVLSLALAPEWRDQLDRLNRVRAVHGTTALEGNPLSEAEVSYQLDLTEQEEGPLTGTLSREQRQIRNAARAQTWVKNHFSPDALPVGVGDILFMHKMITQTSNESGNIPGQFRSSSNVVVGTKELGGVHAGIPHDRLPGIMEEFVEFVNSKKLLNEHPVIRALLVHFFLVTLHPFGDGNGRVSRLLEAGILFQHGYNVHGFYGLSNFFYTNRNEYITSLQSSRRVHPFDVTPFILFGVRGFASELLDINNFIKMKFNRVMYRQMLVANNNIRISERRRMLNGREYQLLLFLLDETEPLDPFSENPSRQISLDELIKSAYVKGAYRNLTRRTFVREIVRLAQLGFIKYHSEEEKMIVEMDFDAIAKYRIS